jgi:acetolactate decarboxylase
MPRPATTPRKSQDAAVVKTTDLIQAVRIDGTFSHVATRTVYGAIPPYPPLTEATADEPMTDFNDITGTLAGFRTPDYEQGISVADYHVHFINEPRAVVMLWTSK